MFSIIIPTLNNFHYLKIYESSSKVKNFIVDFTDIYHIIKIYKIKKVQNIVLDFMVTPEGFEPSTVRAEI